MENLHDTLSNQDVRQLWTRFEGLVGHQLHRLQEDGDPTNIEAPLAADKAASFGAMTAGRSSSVCSVIASEMSSLTTANSPPCLLEPCCNEIGESCVDGQLYNADCDVTEGGDNGGGGAGAGGACFQEGDIGMEDVFIGSPVDGCVGVGLVFDDRDVVGSAVDGYIDSVAEEEEADGDGGSGDGVGLETSLSCCLVPSDGSSTSQVSGFSGVMKRNSSTNAVNSSESQPLFGLPYVARAASPLLSLLMVTLEECNGKGAPVADTLLKLKGKRRECKRNMIGVYKQSLLLESQLHQYLNPGLVTSLNRRVARATFDAETMAKLIDKLKRESKRSVDDPDRKPKVVEVSSRIKSLLGRQKCEWQCVGRLKETLTMAREMKDLLRFIAKLSNTLEKSKSAFGGLQDRPPPYEYCSPYSSIPKTMSDPIRLAKKTDSSDKESNSTAISKAIKETTGVQDPDKEVKINQEFRSNSRVTDLSSLISESGWTTGSGDHHGYLRRLRRRGKSIKDRVTPKGRSLSPRKVSRSPGPHRSRSTDFEVDSYSSYRDSNAMSSAKEGLSVNSNESRPIMFDLPCINTKELHCVQREWVVNQVSRDEDNCMGYKGKRLPDSVDIEPTLNQRLSVEFEQECQGTCQMTGNEQGGVGECKMVCKPMKNGSPPRACPRNDPCSPCREPGFSERCPCENDRGGSDRTCVIVRDGSSPPFSGQQTNTRWDRSSRTRSKLSDVEGPGTFNYATASSHYASNNSSEIYSDKNPSENSKSPMDISKQSQHEDSSKQSQREDSSKQSQYESSPKHSLQGKRSSKAESIRSSPGKGKRAESFQSATEKGSLRGKVSVGKTSASQSQKGSRHNRQSVRSQSHKASSRSRGSYSEGDSPPDDSNGGSLVSCDGSEGSGGSNSILIDIESNYPNNQQSASCPPGCRRIRVSVKKRSSSTSCSKRKSHDKEEDKASKKTNEYDPLAALATRIPGVGGSASENVSNQEEVKEDIVSTSGPPVVDTELKAEPSLPPSPKPKESVVKDSQPPSPKRKESNVKGSPPPSPKRKESSVKGSARSSPPPKEKSPPPSETRSQSSSKAKLPGATTSQSVKDYSPVPEEEDRGWMSFISNYELPFIGKLDKPWKRWVAGLMLLLLTLLLLSFLSGSCCGCGYLPNPFFFLTNSLASRVTLRHNGLAPV